MDAKTLVGKFRALESQRKTVEEVWQEIERFVAPHKGKFFPSNVGEGGVEWKRRNIYDSTAVQSHIQLASSIHGSLTNPAIRWFEMKWRDKAMGHDHAAQIWLEDASNRIYNELLDSNFNSEANQAYRNLTSFGTAFVTQEPKADLTEDWQGLNFSSPPLKQCYFEPDDQGQCYTFFRHLSWRASKVVAKFGDDTPEDVRRKYENNTDEEVSVLFAVWPRNNGQDADRVLTPENRPFGWAYILLNDAHVIDKGGYYEMPAYVPRWEITDESMWGHSPAHYALADILTLNQLVQLDLKSREKVVDPALLANERALISNLDLGPGALNAVRDINGIKAFESAARFDAVESTIVRLQMAVRKYFYIDQLELKESPAMTATEVQVRVELMQRLLASPMTRLKEDFLDPLLQRTFNLLYRAGELGEPPEGLDLSDYDIEYVGPLARAQRFDESASIERWITQLQLIAQMGGAAEQVMLVPDYDYIARRAATQLNLPTEMTRSPDDVKADIEAAKDQQTRQASADAAAAESAAAKDLTQAEQLRGGQQGIGGPTPV